MLLKTRGNVSPGKMTGKVCSVMGVWGLTLELFLKLASERCIMKHILTYSLAFSRERKYKLARKCFCSSTCKFLTRTHQVAYFGRGGLEKQPGGPCYSSHSRYKFKSMDHFIPAVFFDNL